MDNIELQLLTTPLSMPLSIEKKKNNAKSNLTKDEKIENLEISDLKMVKFSLINIFTYSDYYICTTLLNFLLVITSPIEQSASTSYAMAFYTFTLFSLINGFLDSLMIYGSQAAALDKLSSLNLFWR